MVKVLFLGTVATISDISGITHDGRVKLSLVCVQPCKCLQAESFFPDLEGRLHWILIGTMPYSDWEVIHSTACMTIVM